MIDKKDLLNKLIALRENGPQNASCGICPNVQAYSDLKPHFVTWPNYSGDSDYPVPSTDKSGSAEEMYWHWSDNKWVGEYGDLRRNLLDHLITEISKEIDNE